MSTVYNVCVPVNTAIPQLTECWSARSNLIKLPCKTRCLLQCNFFLVFLDSFMSVVNKSVKRLGCSMFWVVVFCFFNKESWITTLLLLVFASITLILEVAMFICLPPSTWLALPSVPLAGGSEQWQRPFLCHHPPFEDSSYHFGVLHMLKLRERESGWVLGQRWEQMAAKKSQQEWAASVVLT